jgi:hypothetical protein
MKNSRQIEVRSLLSFGAKSFVFQFAIQKKYTYVNVYGTTVLPLDFYGCENGH